MTTEEPIARPIFSEPMPMDVARLGKISRALKALYPKQETTMTHCGRRMVFFTPGKSCNCHECEALLRPWLDEMDALSWGGMILCPECGNKRCPKASDHEMECTGSNEPGQFGSRY